MGSRISADGLLRAVVEAGGIPETAMSGSLRGRMEWVDVDRGLRLTACVSRSRAAAQLQRVLWVSDLSRLAGRPAEGLSGGSHVDVVDVDGLPATSWPTGAAEAREAITDCARFFAAAGGFVRSLIDLDVDARGR